MKLFHGTHHSVTELPMGSKSDANLPDPHSPTMLHHKIKKGKQLPLPLKIAGIKVRTGSFCFKTKNYKGE